MMKIAILGASSHIAKSLIYHFWHNDRDKAIGLCLYGRAPEKINQWLSAHQISIRTECKSFNQFGQHIYDLVINMVGTSNASDVSRLGAQVFHTALEYDELVLGYLRSHPHCRYYFLSSGAVYGNDFIEPAQQTTLARHAVNSDEPSDWYGLSKFCIEAKHRALAQYAIVDIRVFSFFSSWIDLEHPFFLTDAVKSIAKGCVLQTQRADFWRDYSGSIDLAQLFNCFLNSPPCNTAIDLYSKNPIRKLRILELLATDFRLEYAFTDSESDANLQRAQYFSENRSAERWGYLPSLDSEQLIKIETTKILKVLQS